MLPSHKRHELLINTTTQITLKRIMLTTGSQIQKATYCIIPTYNILERKTTGESHSVVARGWDEESVDCKETMKGNIGEWWHYFLL